MSERFEALGVENLHTGFVFTGFKEKRGESELSESLSEQIYVYEVAGHYRVATGPSESLDGVELARHEDGEYLFGRVYLADYADLGVVDWSL